jgi:hypothetical protein
MIISCKRIELDSQRARRVRGCYAIAVPLMLLVLWAAPAVATVRLIMSVNGVTILDKSAPGATEYFDKIAPASNVAIEGRGRAFQSSQTDADVLVVGTASATGRAIVTGAATYRLVAPAGANFAGVAGGKLVIYAILRGQLSGSATVDLAVDVTARQGSQWDAPGSDKASITNRPGNEQTELTIVVPLPATLDPERRFDVDIQLGLNAMASIVANNQLQTSRADNVSGKSTGFAVLNAAGAQVTGFTLSNSASIVIPERIPTPGGQALAIEYYHAQFEHYFITSIATEIGKLDSGEIPGWERTGEAFNVYTVAAAGRVAVCRFFSTAFGAKSSHFYAPRGLGCEPVLQNRDWLFEDDVFFTLLPDPVSGDCPAGNVPVYRLFNNGHGGAPNHRFTTSDAIRLNMIGDGFIGEGYGIGVGMCSPQ